MLQESELTHFKAKLEESHSSDIDRYQAMKVASHMLALFTTAKPKQELVAQYRTLKQEYTRKLDEYDNMVRNRRGEVSTAQFSSSDQLQSSRVDIFCLDAK